MITIEKKELPKEVADAFEVLKKNYGSDLLSRGYDYLKFIVMRPRRNDAQTIEAAIEVFHHVKQQDEPMRYYSELLLAGYTKAKTQEEINKEELANAKEMLYERLSFLEDFAKNGPEPIRRNYEKGRKPRSHATMEAVYEALDKIEL